MPPALVFLFHALKIFSPPTSGRKDKRMKIKRIEYFFLLFFIPFLLFSFIGCETQSETPVKISLSSVDQEEPANKKEKKETLRIAISAVISPKETFFLYKNLLDYISKKIGLEVELIQRETYEEVNNLVKDNALDLAFVCSGAYIVGHDQFGMELLVAPIAYGEPVYYSYIIVPKNSAAKTVEDLRGKRFAFTDPMSNTGKLATTYMLAQMNESVDSFFGDYLFTYSHDRSIEMVAYNLVDGAAIDGLIWEYLNVKNPKITSETVIIHKSEPFGIPPIVVPPSLDQNLKERLRNLFLNIHLDEKGKQIIDDLLIEKFIVPDDGKYDSIRKMRASVED